MKIKRVLLRVLAFAVSLNTVVSGISSVCEAETLTGKVAVAAFTSAQKINVENTVGPYTVEGGMSAAGGTLKIGGQELETFCIDRGKHCCTGDTYVCMRLLLGSDVWYQQSMSMIHYSREAETYAGYLSSGDTERLHAIYQLLIWQAASGNLDVFSLSEDERKANITNELTNTLFDGEHLTTDSGNLAAFAGKIVDDNVKLATKNHYLWKCIRCSNGYSPDEHQRIISGGNMKAYILGKDYSGDLSTLPTPGDDDEGEGANPDPGPGGGDDPSDPDPGPGGGGGDPSNPDPSKPSPTNPEPSKPSPSKPNPSKPSPGGEDPGEKKPGGDNDDDDDPEDKKKTDDTPEKIEAVLPVKPTVPPGKTDPRVPVNPSPKDPAKPGDIKDDGPEKEDKDPNAPDNDDPVKDEPGSDKPGDDGSRPKPGPGDSSPDKPETGRDSDQGDGPDNSDYGSDRSFREKLVSFFADPIRMAVSAVEDIKAGNVEEGKQKLRKALKKAAAPIAATTGTAAAAGGGTWFFLWFFKRRKLRFDGVLGDGMGDIVLKGDLSDTDAVFIPYIVERYNKGRMSMDDYFERVYGLPCRTKLHPDYRMIVTVDGESRGEEKASQRKLFTYLDEAQKIEGTTDVTVHFMLRGKEQQVLTYHVRKDNHEQVDHIDNNSKSGNAGLVLRLLRKIGGRKDD